MPGWSLPVLLSPPPFGVVVRRSLMGLAIVIGERGVYDARVGGLREGSCSRPRRDLSFFFSRRRVLLVSCGSRRGSPTRGRVVQGTDLCVFSTSAAKQETENAVAGMASIFEVQCRSRRDVRCMRADPCGRAPGAQSPTSMRVSVSAPGLAPASVLVALTSERHDGAEKSAWLLSTSYFVFVRRVLEELAVLPVDIWP